MHREEEYTDYSCSTSLERLSRDIETVLRAWHVDRGSDRHVSVVKSTDADDPSSSLIRSTALAWNITVVDRNGDRASTLIDLELALWDGQSTLVLDDDDEEGEVVDGLLAKSLRRRPFTQMPAHHHFFDNFSSLFGIGQHISLTPVQPDPIPEIVLESIGRMILTRHAPGVNAKTMLGYTISGWLQNALNIALSNCQCSIPAIGMWGLYRPNELGNAASLSDAMSVSSHSVASTALSRQLATGLTIIPVWGKAWYEAQLPNTSNKFRQRALNENFLNRNFCPPLMTGSVIGPSSVEVPGTHGKFWCFFMDSNASYDTSRLTHWADRLLQQCDDDTVVLAGARHVYRWKKPKRIVRLGVSSLFALSREEEEAEQRAMQEWRGLIGPVVVDLTDSEESYRQLCRNVVLRLLERAFREHGVSLSTYSPIWGPMDDPVETMYATICWNGKIVDGIAGPLLTFPLRIRSAREVSKEDYKEMQESMERAILDPMQPSSFSVQVVYDRESNPASLAATQKCTLAALIRTATLPGEMTLQHLTDIDLIDRWDDEAGTVVATKFGERAGVGSTTLQLVQAMDWASTVEDMISVEDAESIIHDIMDGSLLYSFPGSPEDSFLDDSSVYFPFRKAAPFGRMLSLLFGYMAKLRSVSSMALVWNVFVQELRRRWEARESIPNMRYVPGLDPHPLTLYEKRCYSTIGHKANFSAFLHCSEPDPDDFNCLIGQKLQVFNLGVESIIAAEIAEHEAIENFLGTGQLPVTAATDNGQFENSVDPDKPDAMAMSDDEMENSNESSDEVAEVAAKPLERTETEIPADLSTEQASMTTKENGTKKDYGPPTIDTNNEFWVMDEPGYTANLDVGLDYVAPPVEDENFDEAAPARAEHELQRSMSKRIDASNKAVKRRSSIGQFIVENLPNNAASAWSGTIMDGDDGSGNSHRSVVTGTSMSQMYYDAAEAGSIFSSKNEFVALDAVVNPEDIQMRPGARCPVQGFTLSKSNDQLYAPYLQRPFPLTDDALLERRLMLSREIEAKKSESGKALLRKVELSQRLQKPKLVSDMRAFKAANPNAAFEDFTNWYGNPGSPLDDYAESPIMVGASVSQASNDSAALKLDRASEAMKVLTATRDFWTSCWEEAQPAPAVEQDPLFNVPSTVEMALDYLEHVHPVNLMNQIMAVNLSTAYFVLAASAGDAMKVPRVSSCMSSLRQAIIRALSLLARDAAGGANGLYFGVEPPEMNSTSSQRFASDESIRSCEQACNQMASAETVVSRAVSLWQKFPGEADFIDDVLKSPTGSPIPLPKGEGRSKCLSSMETTISSDSSGVSSSDSANSARPLVREYVFRNLDESCPCQLAVRSGVCPGVDTIERPDSGVLVAIAKAFKD